MRTIPPIDVRLLYDRFDVPVTPFDCGAKCAPHNPSGKPFCCDICLAVPAAYRQEWEYLQHSTNLWHAWRGDECQENIEDPDELQAEYAEHMLPLACLGPEHCQRSFRLMSCRQFPFFPYLTSDGRFIGLAYDWTFESSCWVISHLDLVTDEFRQAFVQAYDELLDRSREDFESYMLLSEQMRAHFADQKRRIPILHRNGGYYLLSPGSERQRRVTSTALKQFHPYLQEA